MTWDEYSSCLMSFHAFKNKVEKEIEEYLYSSLWQQYKSWLTSISRIKRLFGSKCLLITHNFQPSLAAYWALAEYVQQHIQIEATYL